MELSGGDAVQHKFLMVFTFCTFYWGDGHISVITCQPWWLLLHSVWSTTFTRHQTWKDLFNGHFQMLLLITSCRFTITVIWLLVCSASPIGVLWKHVFGTIPLMPCSQTMFLLWTTLSYVSHDATIDFPFLQRYHLYKLFFLDIRHQTSLFFFFFYYLYLLDTDIKYL